MASLIEAEAGNAPYSIKRRVAGVLYNRLNKNIPLQVDAVFSYIKKKHLSKVYYSDLKIKSKYNTYKYAGLPPTPINNPSIASIKAALNPEKTNYMYYLTDREGKFYFSKTGNEHINKKNKYLK